MTASSEFEAFYRENHPRLWAYLCRCFGDPSIADDAAQEAFVRWLTSRGPTLEPGVRRSYLFKIGENLARDLLRRARRERRVALELLENEASADAESHSLAPLRLALRELSPRQRKLLWLVYAEGFTHAEVSRVLGIASGSVRVLLHRARKRLERSLAPEEQDGSIE
jgi:RNA polymerase sigma-70 factor (ECF subfamily)